MDPTFIPHQQNRFPNLNTESTSSLQPAPAQDSSHINKIESHDLNTEPTSPLHPGPNQDSSNINNTKSHNFNTKPTTALNPAPALHTTIKQPMVATTTIAYLHFCVPSVGTRTLMPYSTCSLHSAKRLLPTKLVRFCQRFHPFSQLRLPHHFFPVHRRLLVSCVTSICKRKYEPPPIKAKCFGSTPARG